MARKPFGERLIAIMNDGLNKSHEGARIMHTIQIAIAPIPLPHNRILHIKRPVILTVTHDKGLTTFQDDYYNIIVTTPTNLYPQKMLMSDVREQIMVNWIEYVKCPIEDLLPPAIELRHRLESAMTVTQKDNGQ